MSSFYFDSESGEGSDQETGFSNDSSFYYSDGEVDSDLDLFDPIPNDSDPDLELEDDWTREGGVEYIDLETYRSIEIVDLTRESSSNTSSPPLEVTDLSNSEGWIESPILLPSPNRGISPMPSQRTNSQMHRTGAPYSTARRTGGAPLTAQQRAQWIVDQAYDQTYNHQQPSPTARRMPTMNDRFLFSPFMALHFPIAFQGRPQQEENISYERLLLLQERLGEVKERGVPVSMIESQMEKFTYSSKYPKAEDGNRCAICLEDLKPRNVCRQTQCNHVFHAKCIEKWLKKNAICPVCRGEALKR